MASTDTVDDRNRIARIALAGVAALVAVRALRRGKRKTGILAALGAVALGYTARSGPGSPAAEVDVEDAPVETETTSVAETTASETDVKLRCAACDEPIVPGQSRGPDQNDRTVHEACIEVVA
jgi:uncharacterized membrane protein (TIGR02234 family)